MWVILIEIVLDQIVRPQNLEEIMFVFSDLDSLTNMMN